MHFTEVLTVIIVMMLALGFFGCAMPTRESDIQQCKVDYLNSHLNDLQDVEEMMDRVCF